MTTRRRFALIFALFAAFWLIPSARAEGTAPPKPGGEQPAKPAGEQTPPAKPEARREDIEPATLTEARTELATARADRDQAEADLVKANADLAAAQDLLTTATTERDEARSQLADAKTKLTAAEADQGKLVTITGLLKTALGLTDAQMDAITDPTTIPAAIQDLAQRKAIDIAAGQGVPPVRTKPGADTEADEIKADFAAAAQESDPRKRGAMYAAASGRLAASKSGRN